MANPDRPTGYNGILDALRNLVQVEAEKSGQPPVAEAQRLLGFLVEDLGAPYVTIGRMSIGPGMAPGQIWLAIEGEEAGDFPPGEIEVVLLDYFNRRF